MSRKTGWRRGLAGWMAGLMVICGSISLGTAESASLSVLPEAGLQQGVIAEDLDGFFSWCYTTADLPEHVEAREMKITVATLQVPVEEVPAWVTKGQAQEETTGEPAEDEAPAWTTKGQEQEETAEESAENEEPEAENATDQATDTAEEPAGDEEPAEETESGPATEPVISARVEFLEGEEALRDAVTAEADGTITIDNAKLTTAGTARFRLTFETEHCIAEREETLTVLDFAETPSLTELYVDPVFYMTPGQQFTSQQALRAIAQEDYGTLGLLMGLAAPMTELDIEPKDLAGMVWDEEKDLFTVEDFGMYDLIIHRSVSNLTWTLPFQVQATAYSITGPTWLMPGQSGQFRVTDVDAAAGRSYRWSVSENEAEIDEKTGALTVGKNAEPGVPLTVTLTPDTGAAIKTQVRIVDGALSVLTETTTEEEAGFQVPAPAGDGWDTHISARRENGWIYRGYGTGVDGATLIIEARTDPIDSGFREDDQAALAYYDETVFNDNARGLQKETMRIDGHYARLYTYTTDGQNRQIYRMGEIAYCRNNRLLTVTVYATRTGAAEDSLIPVTVRDLRALAEQIHYDEEQAPVRQADARLTVAAQDGSDTLGSGRSLQMTATYAGENLGKTQAEKVFRWTVTDTATGEETDAATIAANGRLTASSGLTRTTEVTVTAVSEAYGTKASKRITLIPTAKGIQIDSGDLMLYVGAAEATTVRAVMIPEETPMIGLVWRTTRPNLFEVTEQEDGSVQVRALATGNGYLSVREPGGRAAQIALKAAIPVSSVEISQSGTPRAGSSMKLSAKLLPLEAGVRTYRWSMDVGEDVATISQKGRLVIQPGAKSGTVITVTCTANGAPEPVTAAVRITVE